MRAASRAPVLAALTAFALACVACSPEKSTDVSSAEGGEGSPQAEPAPTPAQLRDSASAFFQTLPSDMSDKAHPLTPEKVALGRMLYHDTRLSKNHDVACQTCHKLEAFGVDGTPTSTGHAGQKGDRNAPTVYNAALHVAQFWDGRAADVEEQAKGPVLNPIEMAMADEAAVVAVLNSIPGYVEAFEAAFPGEGVTYDNMGAAIGAFERKLVTPAPLDEFIAGNDAALDEQAQRGLALFVSAGCTTCHAGPGIGGSMYQKLGLIKPYATEDEGRFKVTEKEADKFVFKVPSLRNIAKTGPYLHDGSVDSLEKMVGIMVEHQTQRGSFSKDETDAMLAFLESLTGEPPADLVAPPTLPESGPNTPAPNPS